MTPAQCDLLLARVRAAHMNAVLIQVRKRSDAYYASHYEPWATDDPEHFDALAYVCRTGPRAGSAPPPGSRLGQRLCRRRPRGAAAAGANHPEWLSLSDTGNDFDGESTKIDPGNPAAADWTYRVYLDIVRTTTLTAPPRLYPLWRLGQDRGPLGIQPRLRRPLHARYGAAGPPVWNDPRWLQWRRDQVTAFVRRVSVEAHALKPHLIVSAGHDLLGRRAER